MDGGGANASPERSKQLLKEKLQQQVMLHVRKAEAKFEAQVAALEKQLQETQEELATTKKQFDDEHQQLTDALNLMEEYEQGLEAAAAAELRALDLEAERNAAVEAREQLELKNTILQRKVQNLEKQYNVLQEEKAAEVEAKELSTLDLQDEIVKLREALLEAQEMSLVSAVKKKAVEPAESGTSAQELAELRSAKAALEQELQAAKKEVAKADLYKKEAEELSLFVEMLEEDVRAMKEDTPAAAPAGTRSSVAPQTNEEERIAELQALLDIGNEELDMTKEQLDNVTKLYNLEKRNTTLLARKYKELDKSYRDLVDNAPQTPLDGEGDAKRSADDSELVKTLKAKIGQLTSRLAEQDAAVESLVSEKATIEAHYQTSARRMTVELDKYKPGPSSAPEGVQHVAGMPSFDQVSKQLRQLEPSLHSCSWREKANILLVLMTADPKEQKRLMAKIRL